MTGGQPVDGTLSVPQIAHQMRSRGRADDRRGQRRDRRSGPSRRSSRPASSSSTASELDDVQKRLREVKGTSILIYDQTCATEKRRRRKRGKMVDPHKRVVINTLVCEGCGDCGRRSPTACRCCRRRPSSGASARSTSPTATRTIPASKGFCPSFVTVHGGGPRKGKKKDRGRTSGQPAGAGVQGRFRSSPGTSSSPASAAPAWSPSAPCWAWPGIWKARAPACWTRPAWRRRAARSPRISASRARPSTSTPCASPPAKPTWCWAATWWWSMTTGCCRRCAAGVRRWC